MSELDDVLDRARARRRLPAPAVRQQLREGAGLSQQDIARELGVTREAVARWELGQRTPRPGTAYRYLELLHGLARAALS